MEDSLSKLVPSDVLAAHSYWDNSYRNTTRPPEQALMRAVLEDAIGCIQNNTLTSRAKVWREAAEWVMEKNSEQLFSFENICAVLGLDASYLRKGILTFERHHAAKVRRGESPSLGRKLAAAESKITKAA